MPGPDQIDGRGVAAQLFGDRLLDPVEAASIEVRGTTQSAVLVTIAERSGQPWSVFTRRPDDLRRHAGEISFPGGRVEETDASLVETALREAQEEIGLDPAGVTILGALQPTPTIATGYARRRLVRRGVPIRTDTYVVGDHLIWGATARILGDLFDRIEL